MPNNHVANICCNFPESEIVFCVSLGIAFIYIYLKKSALGIDYVVTIDLSINPQLVDTDGSEFLILKLSDVPEGVQLTMGSLVTETGQLAPNLDITFEAGDWLIVIPP